MKNSKFYHVMVQGINKEYIFFDDHNKEIYLNKINETAQKHKTKIIAYCIMGNHAHFLMYVQKIDELSKTMKEANSMYAKYFNWKFDRVGYVFRDRFLSEEIDCERYFIKCINYIHNNPVKAGIVKDKAMYEYSNYKEIIKPKNLAYIEEITGMKLSKSDFGSNSSKAIFKDIEMDRNEYINDWISEFCMNNKVSLAEIFESKEILCKMVKILKEENGISYEEIMERLSITRKNMEKLK